MRYSKIRKMDISNGEGLGVSLFVQGCHFHCKGCFNSETWDFNGGKEWNDQIEHQFFELVSKPHIVRVTILGGEPLCDENVGTVNSIIKKLHNLYPNKKVWLYTGYTVENILKNVSSYKFDVLRKNSVLESDIVVDGPFIIEKQDLYNEHILWAGSTNQRVLNIKELKGVNNE